MFISRGLQKQGRGTEQDPRVDWRQDMSLQYGVQLADTSAMQKLADKFQPQRRRSSTLASLNQRPYSFLDQQT